jgi:hypothetical protein
MSPKDRQAVSEIIAGHVKRDKRLTAPYMPSRDRMTDGVDIDAIHRTWPHQRGLFRKQRRLTEHPANWVMLALAVGCLIGWALGKLG